MRFTYNPRIIRQLGYDLITSDEVAITELIKNAYDAEAKKVDISLYSSSEDIKFQTLVQPVPDKIYKLIEENSSQSLIVIEDDGKGMSYDTLKLGFFEVGSRIKRDERDSSSNEEKEKIILGDKGIGRLSAQRISPILIVETCVENGSQIDIIEVNWNLFIDNIGYDAPEYKADKKDKKDKKAYTRLWLIGDINRNVKLDNYYEEKEEFAVEDLFGNQGESIGKFLHVTDDLNTALSFLYSPFEEKKSVIDLNIFFDNKEVKFNFNYQALKLAESIHSFDSEIVYDAEKTPVDIKFKLQLSLNPWFIERIHHSELGKVLYQDWKREHTEYKTIYEKYRDHYASNLNRTYLFTELFPNLSKISGDKNTEKYFIYAISAIAPLIGEIHTFKRDNTLMSMARESAIANGYIGSNISIRSDIRPFLKCHNGIKLYRSAFRIGTIGNKDNDWLKLQQKRTSGQQFYRFELGNVIGFIKVNDSNQKYIYETSSREHLTDNFHVAALRMVLNKIMEIFSPGFTKKAVEITKYILDLEGWLPENSDKQIEREVDKSKETLEAAKQNIKAIQKAISAVKDNIDLDTEQKRESVKKIFTELEPSVLNFEENIEQTNKAFKSANTLLAVAQQVQSRVKTEAYNNYKLMANGLVTEIITHELHSLLSNSDKEAKIYDTHFKTIEDYFLDNELYAINKDHFAPIKNKFQHLFTRMADLDKFYSFLEKTFITKEGNEILEPVDVENELDVISERFKFRFKRHKIDIDCSSIKSTWDVPKGSLLHVFYNLIDNSIYWIRERQKLARKDSFYEIEGKDKIKISSVSASSIQFSDTGTGVLEKYKHSLFNELESGKENGRGMGLYIVRQFLKSFGGEIELLPATNYYGNQYIFEIRINGADGNDD